MSDKVKLKYTCILELEVNRTSYPEGSTDEQILEMERGNAAEAIIGAVSYTDTPKITVEIVP